MITSLCLRRLRQHGLNPVRLKTSVSSSSHYPFYVSRIAVQ
jgi:hypothetical protein